MSTNFGAILTAMVTPFDANGNVDNAAAVKLLRHLFENGSDGVVVCGTTGEAPTLGDDEHIDFIATVVNEVRANYPGKSVIAGVGSNDTRHAIMMTERASALGPDGLLHVNPYYNRPSRKGIVAHYEAINGSTDLPIVLYNIPARTGSDMANDLLAELAQRFEHVVAVKQTVTPSLTPIDGLQLYAGNDEDVAAVLDLGGAGGICTITHLFGPLFQRMVQEPQARAQIQASLAEAFKSFGIAPLAVTNKTALNLIGVNVGGVRLPYVPLDEAESETIRVVLEHHGLLQGAQA